MVTVPNKYLKSITDNSRKVSIEETVLLVKFKQLSICAPEKFQVASVGFETINCVMPGQFFTNVEAIQMQIGQFLGPMSSRERDDE